MINVMDYIGLVHKLTNKRYKQFKHRCEYEDLFQVGFTGLMVAAKKFDNSKGVKFITYAYTWIDGYLFKYIRDDKWYLGRNQKERFVASAPSSLDAVISSKSDKSTSYLEQLIDETNQYELSELKMLVDRLPNLLKRVIELRYLDDIPQKQMCKILGITQVTASRYEKKAIQILRKEMLAVG